MITPERLLAFFELLEQMRHAQAEYRRTMCSVLRYKVPQLEQRVDAERAFIRGTLMLDAVELGRAAVEGGAA